MSKFNWDKFIGYDKLAMDSDGCVYAYSAGILFDDEQGVWISEDQSSNTLLLFEPTLEVLHGFVDPIERPDLPPDWWFEQQVKDGGIHNVDFEGQEEGAKYDVRHFNSSGEEVDFPKELPDFSTYVALVDWSDEFNGGQYIGAPGSKPTVWAASQSYGGIMREVWTYLTESELSNISPDWTVNYTQEDDSFPQDFGSTIYNKHAELARQAIWAHFEENECLPDFLVGDTEVLGPFFMGIKVIDDEA